MFNPNPNPPPAEYALREVTLSAVLAAFFGVVAKADGLAIGVLSEPSFSFQAPLPSLALPFLLAPLRPFLVGG